MDSREERTPQGPTPSRPPRRGQHPSLQNQHASPLAHNSAEDFLGLDVEVQRALTGTGFVQRPLPAQAAPSAPPAGPDPRLSTNTTLIPRAGVLPPGQTPQVPPVASHPAPYAPTRGGPEVAFVPTSAQPGPTPAPSWPDAQAAPIAHPHVRGTPHASQPTPGEHRNHPPVQQPLPVPPPAHVQARSAAASVHAATRGTTAQAVPQPPAQPTAQSPARRMPTTPDELAAVPPARTQRTNSWLLSLDDARAGRAGTAPVVHDPSQPVAGAHAPVQLEASFTEGSSVGTRTMPWLVRGLIGAAAASFLFVVGSTLLSPSRPEPQAEVVMPTPAPAARRSEPRAQLADPGPSPSTSASAGTNPRPPKRGAPRTTPVSPVHPTIPEPSAPPSSAQARPVRAEEPPPTFIEIPPPDFAPAIDPQGQKPAIEPGGDPGQGSTSAAALLPSWYPGLVSAPPLARGELGPGPGELSGSPERRARVERWLMAQSRGAEPLEDVSPDYRPGNVEPGSRAPARPGTKPAEPRRGENPVVAASAQPAATTRAEGVWEGSVVPVQQIHGQARILTPQVGRVRLTLASGDVLEGRLCAVGQGQVWIEDSAGARAITRGAIERLEQIADTPDAPAPHASVVATRPTPSGRVRVRTSGGLFYGEIVGQDGDTLTLVTDEGARVTIEGGSVTPAPLRKTLVKRTAVPQAPVGGPEAQAEEDDFDPYDPHGLKKRPPGH